MFHSERQLLVAGVSALALSTICLSTAHAAEAEQATSVEEVIVTATKRAESLQEVPLSITAMTGEQLADRGVESFAELSRLVPGVVQSGIFSSRNWRVLA